MKNSNKKSNRTNRYSLIYYENIEKYIVVLILMNIHKLPEYKVHQNNEPLLGSPIKNIMSLYQYEIINEFIHTENVYSKEKDKILESILEILDKYKTQKAQITHYICSNYKCFLNINCFQKYNENYYI